MSQPESNNSKTQSTQSTQSMHRLLQRQIKRHLGANSAAEPLAPAMEALLAAVNEAYEQADRDRMLAERSLDLASSELLGRNRQLAAAGEKYRGIFENAVMGIFQTTPQGKYLSANAALT